MAQNASEEQAEKPFSLAPAIITPFPGLSIEAPPSDQAQRIERVLENLDKQHDAVKRNMMFLVQRRSKELVERAKRELETAEESASDDEERDEVMKKVGEEMREMIRRVRVPRREASGSREGSFEVQAGDFAEKGKGREGDVEMGGTEQSKKRTEAVIRAELSKELRDLVNVGAAEMERYDGHARRTLRQYNEYLEKVRRKSGSTSVATPVSAGGMGRETDVRRMSNGMPFVGVDMSPVLREFENIEALARRGSK